MNIVYFINRRLQETVISHFVEKKLPHRVKKDRSLQISNKWLDEFVDLCVDLSFELFERPGFCSECTADEYEEIIQKISKINLPWYSYVINGKYNIMYSISDDEQFLDIAFPIKITRKCLTRG
jgi:hypothetical protein